MTEKKAAGFGELMATFFILLPALWALRAFVAVRLWAWFVVPTFDVPVLTFWTWVGGFAMIGLLRSNEYKSRDSVPSGEFTSRAFVHMTFYLMLLGIGARAHWMGTP